jgi:hypothetical protein
VELDDKKEGGWIVDYVYRNTTHLLRASVGYDDTHNLKFVLNTTDLIRVKDYEPPGYWTSDGFWFATIPWKYYVSANFSMDYSPFAHRYLDKRHFYGTNYIGRQLPKNLPDFVPEKIGWTPL